MDDWKKEIIMNNRQKLIEATTCSYTLLAKLLLAGILTEDDFEQLINLRASRASQNELLYTMVLSRERGFEVLLKSLSETSQESAESILQTEYSRTNPYVRFGKLFEKVKESGNKDDLKIVKEELEILGKGNEITRLWEVEEKPLLHCATFYATPELFHELVLHEVSIGKEESLQSRDKWGSSVLHNAVLWFEPLPATLHVFKENGVNMNAKDVLGNTVLFNAIKAGANQQFLTMLIDYGANPRVTNNTQNTVLHHAARHGNLAALYLFISLGCDVKARNVDGDTPLHAAINAKNKHEIVLSLLKHGADVNAMNTSCKKPTDDTHIQYIYDSFHSGGW
ncbi:unnamed protein product [Orchesella dallaii]|uniref:CARD domain-containing protein n=1 Tax=Orchesella dallaii TaxID=48710 RepID=A0ABP1PKJ2_9HEXA